MSEVKQMQKRQKRGTEASVSGSTTERLKRKKKKNTEIIRKKKKKGANLNCGP